MAVLGFMFHKELTAINGLCSGHRATNSKFDKSI